MVMVFEKNTRVDDARFKRIFDFASACGRARDPKSLAIETLNNLERLCHFDQALVYFFCGNGRVSDQYLVNLEEYWSAMYLGHYSDAEGQKYNCFVDLRESASKKTVYVYDWDNEPSTALVPNLIRPRGLKYTCAFPLFDLNGRLRTVISLDRTKSKNFSAEELMNLQLAIPHLNNLHKNFFYQGFSQSAIKRSTWETANLTAREVEIADLLCLGISPNNISRTLHITVATTYKHIRHIYKKMKVSSQQELLVRLLK